MRVAILTFDGFNEIDSFVVAQILGRVKLPGWSVQITCPTPTVSSMNGLRIERQRGLEFARDADAVIVGSGTRTRDIVNDAELMAELRFDPSRQWLASQCSGALVLARLGHMRDIPACTDLRTKPWVIEAGVAVAEQAFYARGNIASAGGCLASYYLATWIITRAAGRDVAAEVLRYVTPVGEQAEWAARAFAAVDPYL